MKKTLKLWQIVGFAFSGIWGIMLHFLYKWTNQSIFTAPFSAVNESIWEHMKILFFPMFVFALIEYSFIGKSLENYWCVKLFGISSGLILIPIIYYSYTGIFGVNADWFNIVIFFIAVAAAYYLEIILFKNKVPCKLQIAAFIILCAVALLFIVFTFIQPQIPIFRDPATGGYGR